MCVCVGTEEKRRWVGVADNVITSKLPGSLLASLNFVGGGVRYRNLSGLGGV
ncbi:hypothetical protein Hanom_Chr07g00647311 [Helianthus anomalus]